MVKYKYLSKQFRIIQLQKLLLFRDNYIICSILTPQFFTNGLLKKLFRPYFFKTNLLNYFFNKTYSGAQFVPKFSNISFICCFENKQQLAQFFVLYNERGFNLFTILFRVCNKAVYLHSSSLIREKTKLFYVSQFYSTVKFLHRQPIVFVCGFVSGFSVLLGRHCF